MDQPRRIAGALGDSAGIGSEVVLKALAQRRVQQAVEPVPFGCRRRLLQQYHTLRQQVVDPRDLLAIPLPGPVRCGLATAVGGAASFAWLT